MNNDKKIFLITGNEEPLDFDLFLRSFTFNQKYSDKNPLIVNFNRNCFHSEENRFIGNNKNKYNKIFEYYTEHNIQTISIDKLLAILQKKSKYNFEEIENNFNYIYLNLGSIEGNYKKLFNIIDNYIVVLKAGNELSSYMFKLLMANKDNLENKYFNIIISNVKKIEDSARFFLKLKTEMQDLLDSSLNINFMGPLMIDKEKAGISQLLGRPNIKVFFEGAFHGNIKYLDNKLQGLSYNKQSGLFFEKLSEIELL